MAELLMTLELRGEIADEYGSLEAGIDAIDSPEHQVYWDDSFVVLPRGTRYIDRVAWVYRAIKHERNARPAPAGDAAPVSVPVRPPLPNETQINSFAHGKLERAVKKFSGGATGGEVVGGTKLPPQDARRVRLMLGIELFRLNDHGKLVVDHRVARKDSRYVLRYLDDSGTRWLDPNVELRGR